MVRSIRSFRNTLLKEVSNNMILASESPRRAELLSIISKDFSVIPALTDEIIPEGTDPHDAVMMLSRQKANVIASTHKNEIIVAADTIVVIDSQILGKPRDESDAAKMLRTLSGQTHTVYTGVCVIYENGTSDGFAVQTDVEFFPLSEAEIAEYIATGEPMDKAGAYGIQGKGALLVKRISGDLYNVMGLPVATLSRIMRTHGVINKQKGSANE